MKKLILLSAAALLYMGVGFAQDNGGDKGKKAKKPHTTKSCPGKECSKKKGS